MKGRRAREGELIEYIYLDADRRNLYVKMVPSTLLDDSHRAYDQEKYVELILKAVETLYPPSATQRSDY